MTAFVSRLAVGTPFLGCVPRPMGLPRLPRKMVGTAAGSAPVSGKSEISVPVGSKKPQVSEKRFAGMVFSMVVEAQVLQTTVLPLPITYWHNSARTALPARSQLVYL